MIIFEKVSYSYPDGVGAIKEMTLHIKAGERVAVLGNNGSGKTTFALLINGILKASSGRIMVNGLNPARLEDSSILKQRVGLVFQNPDNQLVATTVEREIAFSLENMNVRHPEIGIRVDKSLEFFGLCGFRNRLTSELSGGEKQKLALASVMVAEPELLILDEPGSYLDESGKQLLSRAVEGLLFHNKELTVIRITQYSYVTEQYERIIVFKDGNILMDGSPDQIFSDIDSCRTAGIDVPLKYRMKGGIGFPKAGPSTSSGRRATAANTKTISLHAVAFSYDNAHGNQLFDNLNLRLENGRIYGIVGPSGSGKTSLIQLMAGLLEPVTGKIEYEGFDFKPGAVAISFQHPERQFFLETADKEIRFGAENLALPDINAIVEACYKLIGLLKEKFSTRDPFSLSGGEKRRLAFGTILSLRPHFIFFDEPTCGLDAEGVDLFKNMVLRLHGDGIGVVVISHYGNIIFELADKIIALDKGRIDFAGEKEEFFRTYDYSSFLSNPEMVAEQKARWGELRCFTEADLAKAIRKS
jgi:energy-coupling factor transporter ATP-binding protein EcfA2